MSILTETKPSVGSFTADAFAAHLAAQSTAPAWWLDRKRAAYEAFVSLPLPKRTNESWRFSALSGLTLDGFKVGRMDPNPPSNASPFSPSALVFANNAPHCTKICVL